MLPEIPRARRYPFLANIELVNVGSEAKMIERTGDLNLFGCQVGTISPWTVGTKVRLKITYKGASFVAVGRVANVREHGMGMKFMEVADKDQLVLEKWMTELREKVGGHRSSHP